MSILRAVVPAAVVETALYAPAATRRAMVKIVVNNRNVGAAAVTIIHRPGTGPTVIADRKADEAIPAGANRRSPIRCAHLRSRTSPLGLRQEPKKDFTTEKR